MYEQPGTAAFSSTCKRFGPTEQNASVYSLGLCKNTAQGQEKLGNNQGLCGQVHKFEFAAGNMYLEFEPDATVCEGQLLIPLFAGEMIWGRTTHAFIYLLALAYSFLGIAIAADVFMSAIEEITSQTRTVKVMKKERSSQAGRASAADEPGEAAALVAVSSS